MLRLGIAISILGFLSNGTAQANGPASPEASRQSGSIYKEYEITKLQTDPTHYQMWAVLNNRKVPKYARSVEYWEAVALCESSKDGKKPDWKDGGYYAGGTGMALSTWRGYGGYQFARRPNHATKTEQIIVATRVAFVGYQTKNLYRTLDDKMNNRPFFRPPAGMNDWGGKCVKRFVAAWKKYQVESCPQFEEDFKNAGLPVKEFSHIAWRESRCNPKIISKKNGNGSRDYGLVQINSSWKTVTSEVCGTEYGNLKALLKVECNLKVAKWLVDNTEGGLKNWVTYDGA